MSGTGGIGSAWGHPPAEVARAASYPSAPASGAQRRRITGWRAAVVACALVLVAGATTAVVTYLHIPSPAKVVDSYFTALRSADASRALRYGRPPSGDLRYLTSPVLRVQQTMAPMGALTVFGTQLHGDAATVSVRYPVGSGNSAKTMSDSITLHRRSRHWLIDSTSATVRIDVGNGRNRATLAGFTLPTDAVALFPGAAPITYDSDLLEQDPASDPITLSSTGVLRVVPQLTAAGRQALADGMKSAMSTCLEQAAKAPPTCPMTPAAHRSVPGSLRGEVVGLNLAGDPSFLSGDADGMLQIEGTFTVDGNWATLDFDNLPVTRRGKATVPVSARVYVVKPDAVVWVKG